MKRRSIVMLVMCLVVGIMGCSTGTYYSPSVEEPKFPSYRDYSNFGFEDMKSGEYSTLMQINGYSISGYAGDGDSYVFVAKSNSYGYDYSTIEIAGSTLKVIDYDKTEEKIFRGTNDHTQDVHKYDLDVLDNDVLTYEAFNFSDYGVPQRRVRFILLASKNLNPTVFFELLKKNSETFLISKNLSKRISIKSAISDLEKKHGTVICPDSPSFKSGVYGTAYNSFLRLLPYPKVP